MSGLSAFHFLCNKGQGQWCWVGSLGKLSESRAVQGTFPHSPKRAWQWQHRNKGNRATGTPRRGKSTGDCGAQHNWPSKLQTGEVGNKNKKWNPIKSRKHMELTTVVVHLVDTSRIENEKGQKGDVREWKEWETVSQINSYLLHTPQWCALGGFGPLPNIIYWSHSNNGGRRKKERKKKKRKKRKGFLTRLADLDSIFLALQDLLQLHTQDTT